MRIMIKDSLLKAGFIICGEGADGFEAIEKYKTLLPDLLILDIAMPYMDGVAALKEILKDYPKAKVVMCSSRGQDSDVVDALSAGATDFIVKPYQSDRVVSIITKALK
jgi:two-component system chemotaxis response regulator CheY